MGGNENAAKVVAAAVKLPSFYVLTLCFCFFQAEGQFAMKGVEDGVTKFHYMVGALPQDVALRVMPVLEDEPDYDALKQELLFAYELTDMQRAARLLHLPGLGDKLPSTLAAKIIALVPKDATPG